MKAKLIENIMLELKMRAILENRHFDESVFFKLAFMEEKQLKNILKIIPK